MRWASLFYSTLWIPRRIKSITTILSFLRYLSENSPVTGTVVLFLRSPFLGEPVLPIFSCEMECDIVLISVEGVLQYRSSLWLFDSGLILICFQRPNYSTFVFPWRYRLFLFHKSYVFNLPHFLILVFYLTFDTQNHCFAYICPRQYPHCLKTSVSNHYRHTAT